MGVEWIIWEERKRQRHVAQETLVYLGKSGNTQYHGRRHCITTRACHDALMSCLDDHEVVSARIKNEEERQSKDDGQCQKLGQGPI